MLGKENESSKLSEFNEQSLRHIAKQIVIHRMVLMIHIALYIFVNVLLVVINYMTDQYYLIHWQTNFYRLQYIWHTWALFCWGIAVILHIFAYYNYRNGLICHVWDGLMVYHACIFILGNALILFINWFVNNHVDWALWVLLFWGLLLGIHFLFYLQGRARHKEELGKSWLDRQIERELLRAKKK